MVFTSLYCQVSDYAIKHVHPIALVQIFRILTIFLPLLSASLADWSVNETIWELNDLMDTKFSAWGEYAQVFPGELWDPTAQIYAKIENMKKSNAILQLSLMPVAGFWGMSEGDNAQAVQIAKHCANLTRTLGKPVWLRVSTKFPP